FEVGALLRAQNRLTVVVGNTRRRDAVPGDNTDWFNYGGLHREVELLRLPETFIRDFFISLVPDGTYKNIRACVRVDGADQQGTAVLSIPALGVCAEIPVAGGEGELVFTAAPELWSPETPVLYDMTVFYGQDRFLEKAGFREIAARDGCIFLNGREIYLKGVCAHEESVANGRSVTRGEIVENFALARELGCNFMRLAHYPHHEEAARMADEFGIMLWEEIPVYWAIAFDNQETYRNAENQLQELILRDRNRASVVIWSVGNENADSDDRLAFMSGLAGAARQLDPTRLVSAACLVDHHELVIDDRLAAHLDVIGINEYYGWYDPDFSKLPRIFENSRIDKPVVVCEFGADGKAGARGAPDQMHTEEGQRAVYEKQLSILAGVPCVKGMSPWILFDFRCPRRLHAMQNYYNIKGLLSADKTYKKPAFYTMRDFYATLG
ncbi:MAG: glycoside hydrolase family 2, partial [Oscillospiraceae bacterium]|nr:glycoside hydrolase family 2 [Oscillospiraceae bacterium]